MLVYDPYYDIKAVSNSALRHINPAQGGTPSLFKANWDGTAPGLKTSSLEFGNLVHLAVLEPHLLNYKVDNTNTPDKVRDVVRCVFDKVKPQPDPFDLDAGGTLGALKDYQMAIMSALDEVEYQKHWRAETRLKKINEDGANYFKLLADAHEDDSFVITLAQEQRLNSVMFGLARDEYAKSMIYMVSEEYDPKTGAETGVEYLNEQEVTWEDERYAFPLKGKIDRLRVDHNNKEFTVIDLKTTSKTLASFPESFEQYHYARQMAAYIIAASKFLEQKYGETYKPSHNHIIVAVETKGDFRASRFIVTEKSIQAGRQEFDSLLDRLNFHFTTNNWIDDREYIESGFYKL